MPDRPAQRRAAPLLAPTLALGLLCGVLAQTPAAQPQAGSGPMLMSNTDARRTTPLKVGQTFSIVLNQAASTGLRYVFEDPKLTRIVNFQGKSYTPGAAGKSGQQTFTFRAVSVGQTSIRFSVYNGDRKSVRVLRFPVVVSPAVAVARAKPVRLTLANDARSTDVRVGSLVTVALEADPSSGFQYGAPGTNKLGSMQVIRSGYVAAGAGFGAAGVLAGAGLQIYAFRAVQPGQIALSIPYVDSAGNAARTVTFNLNVQ